MYTSVNTEIHLTIFSVHLTIFSVHLTIFSVHLILKEGRKKLVFTGFFQIFATPKHINK